MSRNTSTFQESFGCEDLWNLMSIEKQLKIIDCFENRLPEFLIDVAYGIESEDAVNMIHSVASSCIHMSQKPNLESLY